jgi:hypothetical protein
VHVVKVKVLKGQAYKTQNPLLVREHYYRNGPLAKENAGYEPQEARRQKTKYFLVNQ